MELLRKAIKRRREAAEMFVKGARADLAAVEKAAIAGGAANVGAVMGNVMPQFKGRAEGGP